MLLKKMIATRAIKPGREVPFLSNSTQFNALSREPCEGNMPLWTEIAMFCAEWHFFQGKNDHKAVKRFLGGLKKQQPTEESCCMKNEGFSPQFLREGRRLRASHPKVQNTKPYSPLSVSYTHLTLPTKA